MTKSGRKSALLELSDKDPMKILPFSSGCALVCSTLLIQPVFATPHTPKMGSAERKAIMDATRKVVGKGMKKKIAFTPEHFKVEKGWAYFDGGFVNVDGTEVGQEYMWGNLSALLHLERKRWVVKKYVHNTDVIEPEFMAEFPQAPKAIFYKKPRYFKNPN